jgi:hypothetical protein
MYNRAMQLADDASAIALEEGIEYYISYGREGEDAPEDMTHVRIDSSVGVIKG